MTATHYLTPPAVARLLGIKAERVIEFVRSGELRAVDVARRGSRRPRYRISQDALVAFEAARSVTPLPKPIRRQRQNQGEIIEFY